MLLDGAEGAHAVGCGLLSDLDVATGTSELGPDGED